jgi:hypothetical protein
VADEGDKPMKKTWVMLKDMKRKWRKAVKRSAFRHVKFGAGLNLKDDALDVALNHMGFRPDKVESHAEMLEKELKAAITDVRGAVLRSIKLVYLGKSIAVRVRCDSVFAYPVCVYFLFVRCCQIP